MAQLYAKKTSDGKPKAVECTDAGEIKVDLNAGEGLATQVTVATMAADIALMKADLAAIRAILES
jgi:hypothetical protein